MSSSDILFIVFFLHRITRSYRIHSCCTDYARNLNGKRPVRSWNRNCMMYSHADFADDADLDLFGRGTGTA